MSDKNTKAFIKKHPILFTLFMICAVDIALLIVGYFGLGWFTHHNQYRVVPDLKGMTVAEAESALWSRSLVMEVSDSIYDSYSKPGTVVIQTPKAGSKIKDNRMVYVTIRSYSTQQTSIPAVVDMSLRQGMSMLQSAGLTSIVVERIPSEFSDLIYGVKMNGLTLNPGDKVPINAKITLVVGDGMQQVSDSALLEEHNDAALSGEDDYYSSDEDVEYGF